MSITNTSKNFKMTYKRFHSTPSFNMCLVLYCLCRAPVKDVHYCMRYFCPKLFWHPFLIHHRSGHFNICSISSFKYTILLRSIPCCKLLQNSFIFEIFFKFSTCVFTSSITANGFNAATFFFSTWALNFLNVENASDFPFKK